MFILHKLPWSCTKNDLWVRRGGLIAKVRTRTQWTLRVTAGQEMYFNYFYGKLWGCREEGNRACPHGTLSRVQKGLPSWDTLLFSVGKLSKRTDCFMYKTLYQQCLKLINKSHLHSLRHLHSCVLGQWVPWWQMVLNVVRRKTVFLTGN